MDIKDIYLRDIHAYPLISQDEEIRLSRIIQKGDNEQERESAIHKLVVSNLGLVCTYVRRLYWGGRSVTFMDLVQEGNKALLIAARRYNYDKSQTKFSCYATPAIIRRVLRAIYKDRFIRVPLRHVQYLSRISEIIAERGEEISDKELQKELGSSKVVLNRIRNNRIKVEFPTSSHDSNDPDESSPLENIASDDPTAYEDTKRNELVNYLQKIIKESCSEKAQQMIKQVYNHETHQSEIGSCKGVSRQYIHTYLSEAMDKLRKRIIKDKKDFEGIPKKWLKVVRHEIAPVYRRNRKETIAHKQRRKLLCLTSKQKIEPNLTPSLTNSPK